MLENMHKQIAAIQFMLLMFFSSDFSDADAVVADVRRTGGATEKRVQRAMCTYAGSVNDCCCTSGCLIQAHRREEEKKNAFVI